MSHYPQACKDIIQSTNCNPKLSVIGVAFSSSSDKPPAISDMIVSPSFIGELMSPIDRTIALLPRKSLLLSVALEFIQ